ncbi:hypothetical protein ACEQPO_30325 [Bacillus sp. SL00103]
MIRKLYKADTDYGKRVADGLKAFKQEQPSGPIPAPGSTGAAQAVDDTINNSTPSDPY